MMVLVDTSVWVDFFAGRAGRHVSCLESLLELREDVCICGIVLTEVLQGIRKEKDYVRTRGLFENLIFLPMTYGTFLRSAEIYRTLRRRGVTIRKSMDCMIAAVAIEHAVPLLHDDRDFLPMEKHCGLRPPRSENRE